MVGGSNPPLGTISMKIFAKMNKCSGFITIKRTLLCLIFASGTSFSQAVIDTDKDLSGQVARCFVIGFDGYVLPEIIRTYIVKNPPGGVILFDRNIQSPPQLKALTAAIRQAVPQGVLIMVDQEGGNVARLKEATGCPKATPSAEALGKGPLSKAQAAGYETGCLLKTTGINLDLAPVVDIGLPGRYLKSRGRTFGETPEAVTAYAGAFTEGLHQAGIHNCLKHFPGHGSGVLNPHFEWVDITQTFTPIELQPFKALIEAGLADTIMVGHLFNANWDKVYPASLSKKVIQGMLRENLGYNGLILTDDLDMAAAGKTPDQSALLALEAGVDLLLFCDTGAGLALHPTPEATCELLNRYLEALTTAATNSPQIKEHLQASNKRLEVLIKPNL